MNTETLSSTLARLLHVLCPGPWLQDPLGHTCVLPQSYITPFKSWDWMKETAQLSRSQVRPVNCERSEVSFVSFETSKYFKIIFNKRLSHWTPELEVTKLKSISWNLVLREFTQHYNFVNNFFQPIQHCFINMFKSHRKRGYSHLGDHGVSHGGFVREVHAVNTLWRRGVQGRTGSRRTPLVHPSLSCSRGTPSRRPGTLKANISKVRVEKGY